MNKKVRLIGKKALPLWLTVVLLVTAGAGAAAGTVLAGKVVGEVPVSVSQALLVEAPASGCDLVALETYGDGIATWSTEQVHTGCNSAYLETTSIGDMASVGLIYHNALSNVSSMSFWYFGIVYAGFSGPRVALTLDTDGDSVADLNLLSADLGGSLGTGAWAQWTFGSADYATAMWWVVDTFGNPVLPPVPGPPGATWNDVQTAYGSAIVLDFGVYLGIVGSGADAGSGYVDDVTINNLNYPINSCDLVGIDSVPQGTQRCFAAPNRYFGAVADDNTAFQFAAEIAVGDLYLIALPLKNASENELVALIDLVVYPCLEVEVVSADQIHGEGNVTEAVRIGLNKWKITVLPDAEYETPTDILYIAVQADDYCAPGYYTISGTMKQISH